MGIKTTETVHPRRGQIILKALAQTRMCSESSRGHKWALVSPRDRVDVRADTAVRSQVEEGILVVVIIIIVTLPTRPALVRLVAGIFDGRPRPDVDLDDAIEEFTR